MCTPISTPRDLSPLPASPASPQSLPKGWLRGRIVEALRESSLTLEAQTMPTGRIVPPLDILLKQAFEKIVRARSKEAVIFLGVTGAGKSSLISYLMGRPLILCRYRGSRLAFPPECLGADGKVDGEKLAADNGERYPKLGHSGSQTLVPEVWSSPHLADVALADFPGFIDTRSAEEKLCTAASSHLMVKNLRKIRAVVITLPFSCFERETGPAFLNVCQTINEIFKKRLTKQSIVFVITKPTQILEGERVRLDTTVEDVLERVKEKQGEWNEKLKSGSAKTAATVASLIAGFERISLEGRTEEVEKIGQVCSEQEEAEAVLRVLDLMTEDNIEVANIFDKGESRERIFANIKRKKEALPANLNFECFDAVQAKFRTVITKIADAFGRFTVAQKGCVEELKEYDSQIAEYTSKCRETTLSEETGQMLRHTHEEGIARARQRRQRYEEELSRINTGEPSSLGFLPTPKLSIALRYLRGLVRTGHPLFPVLRLAAEAGVEYIFGRPGRDLMRAAGTMMSATDFSNGLLLQYEGPEIVRADLQPTETGAFMEGTQVITAATETTSPRYEIRFMPHLEAGMVPCEMAADAAVELFARTREIEENAARIRHILRKIEQLNRFIASEQEQVDRTLATTGGEARKRKEHIEKKRDVVAAELKKYEDELNENKTLLDAVRTILITMGHSSEKHQSLLKSLTVSIEGDATAAPPAAAPAV